MNYSADLEAEAEDDLDRLGRKHPLLVSFVLGHIDRLCRDPVGLSRKGGIPHLFYQRYEFISEDGKHRFFVFFQYGQCETVPHVQAVGHVEYE